MDRFADGTRVKVAKRSVETHIRAPAYIQGKTGVVERMCGSFRNPEDLAYGKDGLPKQFLYRVRFLQNVMRAKKYNHHTMDPHILFQNNLF